MVTGEQGAARGRIGTRKPVSQPLRPLVRPAAHGHRVEMLAFAEQQASNVSAAQDVRLLQYRIKYRDEIARRGVDDLQYLGGRGLLLQGLARLGQEPRIFHCDDRLRREVFEQRDLLFGKGPHLLAVDSYYTKERIL